MGVRFYDDALLNKLKKWVKNPDLKILKPDETTRFFEMKLDERKDAPLTLPLISIARDKTVEILNVEKQAKTYDGFAVSNEYKEEYVDNRQKEKIPHKKVVLLNAIPIQIGYQIDIYTKGMEEADEYVRNFVFNFVNYPKLVVHILYNGMDLTHESTIHLESSIMDNSDIREHLFPDQFVRFTLKITVDDAYLFSAPVKDIPIIKGINLSVNDKDEDIVIEEQDLN